MARRLFAGTAQQYRYLDLVTPESHTMKMKVQLVGCYLDYASNPHIWKILPVKCNLCLFDAACGLPLSVSQAQMMSADRCSQVQDVDSGCGDGVLVIFISQLFSDQAPGFFLFQHSFNRASSVIVPYVFHARLTPLPI